MEIKSRSEIIKSGKISEKQGFVKRFLKWIAKGTNKSGIRQGACPT